MTDAQPSADRRLAAQALAANDPTGWFEPLYAEAAGDGHADPHAFLIVENGALTTIHRGHRVPLNVATQADICAYLDSVLAIEPQESPLRTTASQCHAALQLTPTAP